MMIILNKKRLGIIAGILIVAVFAFTFQTAKVEKTVQTVSLPVSNKVIVLDARAWKTRWTEPRAVTEQQKPKPT